MRTEESSLSPPLFAVYPTYAQALRVLSRMTNAGIAQRDIDIVEALPLDYGAMDDIEHCRLASAIESGSVVLVVHTRDEVIRRLARTAIHETALESDEDARTVAASL